ncbi:hypothetical protein EB73_07190 [Mycobacterium sp. SWH-M3]|nr:hypothetical protein EB73_07190 [Mycobacterium sp. SWH-M3]
MTNTEFERHLDSIGAQWAHLGGDDYAVTLTPGPSAESTEAHVDTQPESDKPASPPERTTR